MGWGPDRRGSRQGRGTGREGFQAGGSNKGQVMGLDRGGIQTGNGSRQGVNQGMDPSRGERSKQGREGVQTGGLGKGEVQAGEG